MTTTSTPSLQAPFSQEQLRRDILSIIWMQVRVTSLMFEDPAVCALLGRPRDEDLSLWFMDREPADVHLTYEAVRKSTFALALEQQYDFAFHGLNTYLLESMDYETMHTWVAAVLLDLSVSKFADECESSGVSVRDAIQRCLHVSELANARLILEGEEAFSSFNSERNKEAHTAHGGLTIRQMALLAGMEEMSVRTAASRKGPNQLPTFKEDGRTLVRPADARTWLMARGKYIPVTHSMEAHQLHLDQAGFGSLNQLEDALRNHILYIKANAAPGEDPWSQLEQEFEECGFQPLFNVTPEVVRNEALLRKVAHILHLPPDLLVLRAEQARLGSEIASIEARIAQSSADRPAAQA